MAKKGIKGKISSQSGQILLVVILVVIVALTVGLSLATKTITNLKVTSEQAQSQKALAAAEAGIERVILSNTATTLTGNFADTNSSYKTDVTQVLGTAGTAFLLNNKGRVKQDEGIDVWFMGHNADGSLNTSITSAMSGFTIYWDDTSSGCSSPLPAAMEAVVVATRNGTDTIVYKYAYDPCNTRRNGNNFTDSSGGTITIDGVKLLNNVSIATPAMPANYAVAFIRLIPIYRDTVIGVRNSVALPLQGYKIDSVGTSGNAQRRINVFRGWTQLPIIYLTHGLFVSN